jgi:hypothetical protein
MDNVRNQLLAYCEWRRYTSWTGSYMRSLKSLEGYFLLDHRNSPGVPDSILVPQGLVKGAGQGTFESSTFTCSHCESVVVLNPDRSRPRGYCPKCDHYVCDECEAKRFASGGACYPYKAMCQDILELIDKSPFPGARSGDELIAQAKFTHETKSQIILPP